MQCVKVLLTGPPGAVVSNTTPLWLAAATAAVAADD